MFFPICIGHTDNWANRVGRGEHASHSLQCEHDAVFYGSDTQLPGMIPVSIGHTDEPYTHTWRHSVLQSENAGGSGWYHDFTFYAYPTQVLGTIPVAIGHAANEYGGWKYRCQANITFAGDNGWTHDFVFYAPEVNPEKLTPVAIGYNDQNWAYKAKKGVKCKDDIWKHSFAFKAFTEPQPGTIPLAVGSVGSGYDHRSRMSKSSHAGDNGWDHNFVVHVYNEPKTGTIPLAVGHATLPNGGWKYRFENNTWAGDNGWEHEFVVYVYPLEEGDTNTIPIAVGCESNHWCVLVKEGERVEEGNYNHYFNFYAFGKNVVGTKPISIGDAGHGSHTYRSRIENGPYAGDNGWCQSLTFYAFDRQMPGTVPYGVGHADYEMGGWKYRIMPNQENGGGDGWTPDFTFYAYPSS